MAGRSSSAPVARPEVNPFYSERARREVQIATARPSDLPVPSDNEDLDFPPVANSAQPGSQDQPTGKGQGGVTMRVEGPQVSGCFETPPSKPVTGLLQPLDDGRFGRRVGHLSIFHKRQG